MNTFARLESGEAGERATPPGRVRTRLRNKNQTTRRYAPLHNGEGMKTNHDTLKTHIPRRDLARSALFGLALPAAVILALLAATFPAQAERNLNPRILQPDSNPYGKTYGEWGVAWW